MQKKLLQKYDCSSIFQILIFSELKFDLNIIFASV